MLKYAITMAKSDDNMKIKLGWKVRDSISGLEGIAVSRTEFINGCVRYSVQPKANKKDGTLPPEAWFDEKQLEGVSEGVLVKSTPTGGPTTSKTPRGARA